MAKNLTVAEMPIDDCWKDMARIPGVFRVDEKGKRIHRSTICKVRIGDKQKLLAIRGLPSREPEILLDSSTRGDFGVSLGQECTVELHPVGWLGYWRWAWNAADPGYRVPAQISVISLILGVIGLIIGF